MAVEFSRNRSRHRSTGPHLDRTRILRREKMNPNLGLAVRLFFNVHLHPTAGLLRDLSLELIRATALKPPNRLDVILVSIRPQMM